MFLIVGLGNPGKQYELSRHNIGFRTIDRLSKDLNIAVSKGQCQAMIGQNAFNGKKIILAKPQTFMNLSGDSVAELVRWFKIDQKHLIVIHDDLDLDVGVLRIRTKGNSGGHNGVESIINRSGTGEFIRIKIGIGREVIGGDNSDYVLSIPPKDQMEILDGSVVTAAEAAAEIVNNGPDAAMNKYNPL
jgi:PTH1 family peptidyl-tRNA hydrolase